MALARRLAVAAPPAAAAAVAGRSCRRRPLSSYAPVALEVTDLTDTGAAAAPLTRPPVVFIHGLLGSGTNFRSIALHPSVRAGRRVLTLDLRNHGKSPHTPGPLSLDALAGDVAHTLRGALGGEPCALVGHSLGGKVSSLVALTAPALLRQLVVMDISPVAYSLSDAQWGAVAAVVRAAHGVDPAAQKTRGDIDRALAATVPDAGMRSFVCQNLVMQPDGTYRWRVNLPSLLASLPLFAQFHAPPPHGPYPPAGGLPAHFIGGERSRYILPAHHDAIRAMFPRAVFHTLPGAGHWLHADKPAEFIAWLAGVLPAA